MGVASMVLGFVYTGATGKGMFGDAPYLRGPVAVLSDRAPAFIDYDEALALFESGEAVFLDSRHEYDYQRGHIKGAVNIPLKDLHEHQQLLDAIPRDRPVVTYCDGEECNSSIEMAMKLDSLGFSKIRIFFGGWRLWQAHQQPVE